MLEDEEPAPTLRIEAGGLNDSHHRVLLPVAIDVARLELIDGVRQSPVAQPIQAVVLTSQFECLRPATTGQRGRQYHQKVLLHGRKDTKKSEKRIVNSKKSATVGKIIQVFPYLCNRYDELAAINQQQTARTGTYPS